MQPLFSITDFDELLALRKAVLAAKFDQPDPVLIGSPFIAAIVNRLVAAVDDYYEAQGMGQGSEVDPAVVVPVRNL